MLSLTTPSLNLSISLTKTHSLHLFLSLYISFCVSLSLSISLSLNLHLSQVVDMRWGITEDSTNDHSTTKICLQEIRRCQQISVGPSFVVRVANVISIDKHLVPVISFKKKKRKKDKHELIFQNQHTSASISLAPHYLVNISNLFITDTSISISFAHPYQALLGDKYGFRPIPTEIRASEFRLLRSVVRTYQTSRDVTRLDTWYIRDDNSVPPTHVLQPVSHVYKVS